MAHACGWRSALPGVLDVRQIAPALGDGRITGTVHGLAAGEAIVLVTDHDPTSVLHRLEIERPGTFRRRHLGDGPDVWRVEIGRVALGAISAGEVVGEVAHRYSGALEVMKEMGTESCEPAQGSRQTATPRWRA